jgi:hypothetical protein
MAKLWYRSKTVWVNLIAVVAMIVQSQTGFIIAPEAQAAFIVVINLVLRAITGEELELMKED